MRYKVIRTDIKPYVIECNDEEELYLVLEQFYELSLEEEGLDIKVLNEEDIDITDSYQVESMINSIMEGDNNEG